MEQDSRKKSRRDRMMRSKNFETQEVREIVSKKGRVDRLSYLMDRNNRKCLPDGEERNAKTSKD